MNHHLDQRPRTVILKDGSSSGGGKTTTTTTTETKTEESYEPPPKPFYPYIEGNVYNELLEEKSIADERLDIPSDEKFEKISNVKVELFDTPNPDEDDEPCATTYSDKDGFYHIAPKEPGSYYLRFTYGTYKEGCDTEELKQSVKYNGLDYTAVMAGQHISTTTEITNITTYTTIEKTIIRSGSGCSQVVLAMDISYSTWQEDNDALENEKKAAKELIEKLLSDEKNIYISIVVFAGGKENSSYVVSGNDDNATSVRIISFTNNKERLFEAIDSIQVRDEGDKTPGYLNVHDFIAGTNIEAGLDVAKDTFLDPPAGYEDVEYLRNIILLSDGAPTTDNNTMHEPIYSDDSDEVIAMKLIQIADSTHEKLMELVNDGVNVFSYVVKQEDDYLQEIIERIFDPRDETEERLNGKWFQSNQADAVEIIKNDIAATVKETINKTQETIVNTETIEKTETLMKLFAGLEDEDRRNELTNLYDELNYENVSVIENAFKNDVADDKFIRNAKKFLDDTYMTVYVKQPYIITFDGEEPHPYTGQDLILDEREKFELSVDIKVTGFRLTLSDGTIIEEKAVLPFCDANLQKYEKIQIDDIADPVYIQSLDKEIMHGAKIDIEYTMIVKNESAVPAQGFTLLNYLTNLSKYQHMSILNFNENARMITDTYTNKDYGWQAKEKSELMRPGSKLIATGVWGKLRNDYYIECKYDCDNTDNTALRSGKLYSNGERYVKVILSKVLSSTNDESEFSDSVEIIKYKNDLGVRMRTPYVEEGKLYKQYMGIIPGNGEESLSTTPVVERDYAESNSIFVIPPTGFTNYKIYIFISIVIMLTICVTVGKKKR